MPLYSYVCKCGRRFERFLPLNDDASAQTCQCGEVAEKYLTPVAVIGDYAGYTCPVSGAWIEGRKAHAENLARTGCRVLETGEKEINERRRAYDRAAWEKAIDATVEQEFEALPSHKKEKLVNELEAGATINVTR